MATYYDPSSGVYLQDPFGGAGDGYGYGYDPGYGYDSNIGGDALSGLAGLGVGIGGTLLIEELLREGKGGSGRRGAGVQHAIPGGSIMFNQGGGGVGNQGGGVFVPNLPPGFRAVAAVPNAIASYPAPGGTPPITVYKCLDATGVPVTFNPNQQWPATILHFAVIPPNGWVPGWPS